MQKSARGEECSTDRRSNRNGFESLTKEETSKIRDLRSIFYKQTNLNKTTSEKTSARNRSSAKMLSKTSSKSSKNSRRSSNKLLRGTQKEDHGDENRHEKLINIQNPFCKSKSLLRGSKLRKKRADKTTIPDGVKKINMEKIKFKSPKAQMLGKKQLSKIKLNKRGNKFMTNQNKNEGTNTSNLNSARSKAAVSGSKDSKNKSIKVIKKDYILKPGKGKLRFSSKVKDKIGSRPKLVKK